MILRTQDMALITERLHKLLGDEQLEVNVSVEYTLRVQGQDWEIRGYGPTVEAALKYIEDRYTY